MQFLKIPKDQLFLVTTLGCLTGYFVWAEPMKKYMKENAPTDNTNAVSTVSLCRGRRIILTANRLTRINDHSTG